MQQNIIMFDFDNTIVTSLKYWYKLQYKQIFKLFNMKPVKNFDKLEKGFTSDDYVDFLKKFIKHATRKQLYNTLYKTMEHHYLHDIKLIKGAKEYLYKLKKERKILVLASATWTKLLKTALVHFEIDIFDKVYSEPDLTYSKKQPEFFNIVLKDLNCKAEDIYFYEDTVSSLKTATSLGIECCAVKHSLNKKKLHTVEQQCDTVIKNFKKLI